MNNEKSNCQSFFIEEQIAWTQVGDGVRRQIMGWNETSMLVKVEFLKAGAIGAGHSHPHLQNSYISTGKFEVTVDGATNVLKGGDAFFVQPDAYHGVVCIEPGVLIDVFTPYRAEFISM